MRIPSFKELNKKLSEPMEFTPFFLLRILFGLIAAINPLLIVSNTNVFNTYFKEYEIYFNYFDFIRPFDLETMKILFIISSINALGIAFGFLYKFNCLMYLILTTYFFSINQMFFQNHYYLIILLSLICLFVPLNSQKSIDSKLFPKIKKETLPAVYFLVFKMQMIIVYLFGAIVKINSDWLKAYPLRMWLENFTTMSFWGELRHSTALAYALSYGGLFFDLLIVPGLMYKKTRKISFVLLAGFHFINHNIFQIGVFPFLAFGLTVILFSDWKIVAEAKPIKSNTKYHNWILFWIYLIIQILIPMKHFLYEGNPVWNGKGHFFSWRMRLSELDNNFYFIVINPLTNQRIEINPDSPHPYLTKKQYAFLSMAPDLVVKTAKYIAQDFYNKSGIYPQVYLGGGLSLNGRPLEPYANLSMDLAKEEYHYFTSYPWILPSTKTLPW
jgi:vitamin K-dependent gamma-carboxylase